MGVKTRLSELARLGGRGGCGTGVEPAGGVFTPNCWPASSGSGYGDSHGWDTAGVLTRRSAGNLAWALSWLAPDVRYYVSTFAVTNDMDPYQRSGLCGQQKNIKKIPFRKVLATPGVRPVLAVVLTWMLAHNILYTYIAPFSSLSGMGPMLTVFY